MKGLLLILLFLAMPVQAQAVLIYADSVVAVEDLREAVNSDAEMLEMVPEERYLLEALEEVRGIMEITGKQVRFRECRKLEGQLIRGKRWCNQITL